MHPGCPGGLAQRNPTVVRRHGPVPERRPPDFAQHGDGCFGKAGILEAAASEDNAAFRNSRRDRADGGGETVMQSCRYARQRYVSPEVGQRLIDKVQWWEAFAARSGLEINNNPGPGNKAGGLTNIYEKSLGAVAKGGSTPLMAVYDYAEPVTARGLTFMDTTGYDPISVTGMLAGGCNLVLFTTGRGSVFGSVPAPTIKICTNSETFNRMPEDMDVNAGRVLAGATLAEVAAELLELVIAVASGQPSKSEAQGVGEAEFVPWYLGGTV